MLYNTASGNIMMLANSPLLKIGRGAANTTDEENEDSLSNNMLRQQFAQEKSLIEHMQKSDKK